jgi:AcrR family transcriptional regulator
MGRPKKFSREGVLDKAIPVFWEHGFADTSLQDLEQATGVNKSGLYSEFKDKDELFVESLRHYLVTVGGEATLSKQPLGWKNVERFLKSSYGCMGQRGCFSINSMREFAVAPAGARDLMTESMASLKRFIVRNVEAEHPAMEVSLIADLVLTFFAGISIEQNLHPSKASVARKIGAFMQTIRKA